MGILSAHVAVLNHTFSSVEQKLGCDCRLNGSVNGPRFTLSESFVIIF